MQQPPARHHPQKTLGFLDLKKGCPVWRSLSGVGASIGDPLKVLVGEPYGEFASCGVLETSGG